MNLLRKVGDDVIQVSLSSNSGTGSGGSNAYAGMSRLGLSSYPEKLSKESESYLEEYYDVLAGEYPKNELSCTCCRYKNRLIKTYWNVLDFETEGRESIKFDAIVRYRN